MSHDEKHQTSDNSKKKTFNAGSGDFNQGAEADAHLEDGTTVSDEEKRTGHTDDPGKPRDDKNNGGNRETGAQNSK